MLRFAVYVSLALILLQTTFSEEYPEDCTNKMGDLPGAESCPNEVRTILYKKLNETNPKLRQNCTLEGVSYISSYFNNESAYLELNENVTVSEQLWYREKNTFGRIFDREKPWGKLNISNFINNATTHWSVNLTSGPIKERTEVGCYFDVDFNFTLVCAFA